MCVLFTCASVLCTFTKKLNRMCTPYWCVLSNLYPKNDYNIFYNEFFSMNNINAFTIYHIND